MARVEATMALPFRLQARELATTIGDVVSDASCAEGGVTCVLRMVGDYLLPSAVVFGVCLVLGIVFAMWFAALAARVDGDAESPSSHGRKRLLSEPINTDGTWMRLVEDERGDRLVEVLDGADWRTSTRERSQLALDVPGAARPRS